MIVTMFKVWLILMLFYSVDLINFGLDKNSNSYGPYDINWKRYDLCSGSKAKNLTLYTTELTKVNNSYVAWINFTFLEQTRFEEMKITVNTVKKNQNSLVFSYKVNNPCQHYALAQIIEKELNAKTCVVKKGSYARFVNFTEITHSFFGNSFFYGEYMLKVTAISKKGNIMCLVMNSIFTKKNIS